MSNFWQGVILLAVGVGLTYCGYRWPNDFYYPFKSNIRTMLEAKREKLSKQEIERRNRWSVCSAGVFIILAALFVIFKSTFK